MDVADAGDQPGAGGLVAVQAQRGQLADFQEGRTGIQQQADALARQQLAARRVAGAGGFPAALRGLRRPCPQVRHEVAHGIGIGLEFR